MSEENEQNIDGQDTDVGVGTLTETEEKSAKPPMYRVIMHNDDYTLMEFVVEILVKIFQKSRNDAARIMLQVHKEGKATAGVYTYDIAHTKVHSVHALAKIHEYPLRCTIRQEP